MHARGPHALQRRPRAAGWVGGHLDDYTGLQLLEQFQRLGDVLYGYIGTEVPGERQATVARGFPHVGNAPEQLRQWARSLARLAYRKGADPDPFAEVAAHPWKFTDPEVARAIEKLSARLPEVSDEADDDAGYVVHSETIHLGSFKINDLLGRPPAPPEIAFGPTGASIRFNGGSWDDIDFDAARALQYLIEASPLPVGLGAKIQKKPHLAIKKLPEPIRDRCIKMGPKGYRWDPEFRPAP